MISVVIVCIGEIFVFFYMIIKLYRVIVYLSCKGNLRCKSGMLVIYLWFIVLVISYIINIFKRWCKSRNDIKIICLNMFCVLCLVGCSGKNCYYGS